MSDEANSGRNASTAGPDPLEEKILRRVPVEIVLVAAVLAPAVGLLFGAAAGPAFFAGGALAALGFLWLKSALTRFLLRDGRGALKSAVFLYVLRLLLICGAFLIIILLFPGQILAFGAGFSVIIPVFLAEGVRALGLMKTWKP